MTTMDDLADEARNRKPTSHVVDDGSKYGRNMPNRSARRHWSSGSVPYGYTESYLPSTGTTVWHGPSYNAWWRTQAVNGTSVIGPYSSYGTPGGYRTFGEADWMLVNGIVVPASTWALEQQELGNIPTAAQVANGTAPGQTLVGQSPPINDGAPGEDEDEPTGTLGPADRVSSTAVIGPDGTISGYQDYMWGDRPDPAVVNARRMQYAKEQAWAAVMQERREQGLPDVMNPVEKLMMEQKAEEIAMRSLDFMIGGNPDNLPRSVAPGQSGVTSAYEPGQFWTTYSNGAGFADRQITADEAVVMNYIKNSGAVESGDLVLAKVFSADTSEEERQQILNTYAQEYVQYLGASNTTEDTVEFTWSWNPAEQMFNTAKYVIGKGIDGLTLVYEDYVGPSATLAMSALPMGPETATWDQARQVAPGQMAAVVGQNFGTLASSLYAPLSMPISQGIQSGDWNWNAIGWGFGKMLNRIQNPVSGAIDIGRDVGMNMAMGRSLEDSLAPAAVGLYVPSKVVTTPWIGKDQNLVYDPEFRDAWFVDNEYGSAISGSLGVSIALAWDPLLVAGPIGKGIRVSHRLGMGAGMIRSANDVANLSNRLKLVEQEVYAPFDAARARVEAARIAVEPANYRNQALERITAGLAGREGTARESIQELRSVFNSMGKSEEVAKIDRISDALNGGRISESEALQEITSIANQSRQSLRTSAVDELADAEQTYALAKQIKDRGMRRASPIAKFGDWVLDPKNGKRTAAQIREHSVIKQMPVAAEIAEALTKVRNFHEYSLVMRAAAGDAGAITELGATLPGIARQLKLAKLQKIVDNMASAPDKYGKTMAMIDDEVYNASQDLIALEQRLSPANRMPGADLDAVVVKIVERTGTLRESAQELASTLSRRQRPEDAQAVLKIVQNVDNGRITYDEAFEELTDLAGRMRKKQALDVDQYGYEELDRITLAIKRARQDNAPSEVIDELYARMGYVQEEMNARGFGQFDDPIANERLMMAHRRLHEARERYDMVMQGEVNMFPRTASEIAETQRVIQELARQDVVFRTATESIGTMQGMRGANFARGRLQGAGRYRERMRQRRAERKAVQMETHRGGFIKWVPQTFKLGTGENITVWGAIDGAARVAADFATRPLTYAAMESPIGFVKFAGVSGMDNYREIQAVLNNLKMYGDQADWLALTNKEGQVAARVTGGERKEMLMSMFMRVQQDPNMGAIKAVSSLEKAIVDDMIRRYKGQMSPDEFRQFSKEIREVYKYADRERARQIQNVLENKFWNDEYGNLHKSPFLESQLTQSMPMIDFRRMESLVRGYAKNKKWTRTYKNKNVKPFEEGFRRAQKRYSRALSENDILRQAAKTAPKGAARTEAKDRYARSTQNVKKLRKEMETAYRERDAAMAQSGRARSAWESGLNWYDQFQTLWRAGVLFRLGYPTRNTIDGLSRRFAYEASIAPIIADTIAGARNMAYNVATRRSFTRQASKDAIARRATKSLEEKGRLPRKVRSWADREHSRITGYRDNLIEQRDRAMSALEELRAEVRAGNLSVDDMATVENHLITVARGVAGLDQQISRTSSMMAAFETGNEADLIIAYRQSLDRARRVGDEFVYGVDGSQYFGFMGDPRYGSIMAQNTSARETVQATLGLNYDIARSIMKSNEIITGSRVSPGAPNYFDELSNVLNKHVRNSIVGDLYLARNLTPEQAADYIMTQANSRYRITGGSALREKGRALSKKANRKRASEHDQRMYQDWLNINNLETREDIIDAVRYAWDEFDRYMPNPKVRDALARGQVSTKTLKSLLDNEEYTSLLVAVHGQSISVAAGSGKMLGFMQRVLNPGIDKVYNYIGTMPEDMFIRFPMASRIYRDNVDIGSAILAAQYGGKVPAWAVDQMLNVARMRAVKDVKTFLYTQDRRTNFGRVMERWIPFVSAWQNSVMAYSKLITMNPEVLYYASLAWRAPDVMGLTDDKGNVRIPIPADMVPGGNWDEWVYDKTSLYVWPQAIDPFLTFRSAPLAQMTASQLFQAGLIGPAAPNALKSVLGEEGAQQFWTVVQKGVFGADTSGGDDPITGNAITPSMLPLGADKALPPWLQKFTELALSGFGNTPENNARYATQYTRVYKEQLLMYQRGERETPPDKEEVRQITNDQYVMRAMSNLIGVTGGPFGLITPPQVDSDVWEAAQVYRDLQDIVGYEQADEVWTDLFGDESLILVNTSGTKNNAGMPNDPASWARSEKYSDLIATIAPGLEQGQALSMLGFMLNNGSYTQDDYDPTTRTAKLINNIPGTSTPWQEALTPGEQGTDAVVSAGWGAYSRFMSTVYAEMFARGLASLDSNAAKDLKRQRDEFIEMMRTDPVYNAWHADFQDGRERRIGRALDFMRTVTQNKDFMSDVGQDEQDMWQTAQVWLAARAQFMEAKSQLGDIAYSTDFNTDPSTAGLRNSWTETSTQIAESNARFYEFWIRYLDNDDLTQD